MLHEETTSKRYNQYYLKPWHIPGHTSWYE